MLTYERVNELLRYDPETGKIYWKISRRGKAKAGAEAGTLRRDHRNIYRQIKIDGSKYIAHRLAWLLHYGRWPKDQIDHLDGDGLNNRIDNLREATQQENQKNRRMQRSNTSGVTGVYWNKATGKWLARISINGGKRKSLGLFTDIDEAAKAYRDAAVENGFTSRHGIAV